LYAILVGLIAYALWGFIRALFDPLHRGSDLEGLAVRAGYLVSGISYAFLALATYGLITGGASAARNGASTAQTQQLTATIFTYSWGPWAVGIAGVILTAAGLIQFIQGLRNDFERQFDAYALDAYQRKWMDRLGRFGTAARGVVYTMLGLFLFIAAYRHDPSQAQGIDGVLTALLHQPYGPWLLGVVALGLVAFGAYSAIGGTLLRFKR
jgi:type IV secretory pathway VirB2 component (pilin)